MALETATYISDLNASNPGASDGLSQGDDHIRLLKSTIKATLPNVTGALTASHTALDAAVNATVNGTVSQVVKKGTAGAPGIGFLADLTTGIYSAGASEVDVACAGAKALGITTTGLVVPGSLTVSGSAAFTGQITGPGSAPTGAMVMWFTDSAPTGWLFANGQLVNRTTYAALFSLFGTAFGAGDGSTTFGLPDMRDSVPLGKGTMGATSARGLVTTYSTTTLGASIGEGSHTLSAAEIPAHNHTATSTVTDPGHTHTIFGTNTAAGFTASGNCMGYNASQTTSSATTGITVATTVNNSTGGGGAHNNVQPSVVVNYIIKS